MVWIGITGSMGSGKSAVAAILRQMGYPVLDADAVVRTLLSPGGAAEAEVVQAFGRGVVGGDGKLDRRALGAAVFGDPAKLEKLEWILHPRVRAHVAEEKARLAAAGCPAAFYDVPLLFEKKMEEQFDHVIVVSATPAVRLKRLQARTGLTVQEIEQRWSAQLPAQLKEARASDVIKNNGTLSELETAVVESLRRLQVPPAVKNLG